MTRLSVNVNKFATLRNARGGNNPDLIKTVQDCEDFGADGITIHPRPDERHIRYKDVFEIAKVVKTELNIEGYPTPEFMQLVEAVRPTQVTLVPDAVDALTSNAGWNIPDNFDFLKQIIFHLSSLNIRTSVFVDPSVLMVDYAAKIGTDRIELYTEPYATNYTASPEKAIQPYTECVYLAIKLGLGINAGHDLNLQNLTFFSQNVAHLDEVSIGHALVCDALYLGLKDTIQAYKDCLANNKKLVL